MAYRLSALRGMQVASRDGAAGALNDVLFGEGGLRPRYVAIDQGARFPGRRLLIPPTRVVLGADRRMSTDLERQALRRSISTDPRARLVSGRALCGYRVMTRDWLLPSRQVEIAAARRGRNRPPGRAVHTACLEEVVMDNDPALDRASETGVQPPYVYEEPIIKWVPIVVPLLAALLLFTAFLIEADVL